MYTSFYKLQARPFQLTPDHRFFFEGRSHRKAIAYLTYGLSQREGFVVITGDVGTGKTILVDHLFSKLLVSLGSVDRVDYDAETLGVAGCDQVEKLDMVVSTCTDVEP